LKYYISILKIALLIICTETDKKLIDVQDYNDQLRARVETSKYAKGTVAIVFYI